MAEAMATEIAMRTRELSRTGEPTVEQKVKMEHEELKRLEDLLKNPDFKRYERTANASLSRGNNGTARRRIASTGIKTYGHVAKHNAARRSVLEDLLAHEERRI